ncbi:hypothetical protein BDQ17DRAFT_1369125 [Cyathus striatus]|nr:hypothetical protein BDQ17DRAFT_1369125 [Cyathus striatus]
MMMYNYRTLEGFDLTFNVLGHLVRSGTIIGLVTEPAVGREIKPEDRSLVYKAVAKLQKCGFLLNGILGRMIISERKLRLIFLDFRMGRAGCPCRRNHWGELRRLFLNPTNFYSHWPAVRSSRHGCKILSRIPSPERPLFNAKCIFMILCNSYHDQWQYYRRRTQRTVLSSSKSSNVIVSSSSVTPVENNSDSGLSSNESTPIIPARHLARRQHFRPYYIPI